VDGESIRANAQAFYSLKEGQLLRTGGGRAEVLLGPAVFLRLGGQSALRMVNSSLGDTRVELQRGAGLVEIVETVKHGRIQIGQAETRTDLHRWGLYRFDAEHGELRVFGGEAQVTAGERKAAVGRGWAVQLSGGLTTSKFDGKETDGLLQWAARRSFRLFVSNAEARRQRTDWEFTATGWLWNRNFQTRFFSGVGASEYRRRHRSAEREQTATALH